MKGELDSYEQAVLFAAIDNVLLVQGMDSCKGEFGKNLGKNLFEFRVRQSLNAIANFGKSEDEWARVSGGDRTVLLRVFVTFHGSRVVLLLHGLNKGKDDSAKRQNKEIARARKILRKWQIEETRQRMKPR